MLISVLKFWSQIIKGAFDDVNEKWTELKVAHKLDFCTCIQQMSTKPAGKLFTQQTNWLRSFASISYLSISEIINA